MQSIIRKFELITLRAGAELFRISSRLIVARQAPKKSNTELQSCPDERVAKVASVAVLVDGAVEMLPLALDLNLGFVLHAKTPKAKGRSCDSKVKSQVHRKQLSAPDQNFHSRLSHRRTFAEAKSLSRRTRGAHRLRHSKSFALAPSRFPLSRPGSLLVPRAHMPWNEYRLR